MSDDTGGGASRSTDPAAGSSTATDVSLREFIEARLLLVWEKFRAVDKATALQAEEYERRLNDLNNEAGRLNQAVSKNVSADTWVAFEEQYRRDRQADDDRMKAMERFNNKLLGALAVAVIIVPGVTAIIVYVLTSA